MKSCTLSFMLAACLSAVTAFATPAGQGISLSLDKKVALPPPLPKPVKLSICLFDPMGQGGKITETAKDLALAARDWNLFVDIKVYTDERIAAEDLKAGQCDAAAISSLRAKQFNKAVGSIDSPGNLRTYDEMKSLLTMLANPVIATMAINGRYQIAAVIPIGSIFVFVNDRSINSIEKAAGKRVVVLDWDPTQAKMISGIGAQPVPSDFTTYSGKFNNGQADIIASPAMGYKPLELYKGLGTKGGVIRFPLLQATASIVVRRDLILPKIPDMDARLLQVRQFGLQYLDVLLTLLKDAEMEIPKKYWIELSKEDKDRYYKMLREARIRMTKEGIYDPVMMSVMKRVRCKHQPADAECNLFDE
jgi:hypothetical protein